MRAPIGFRIRNQRKILSVSQVNLAKIIGISPSYLNLIEASKRDVGGLLLQKIAKALEMELHLLSGEGEQRLISDIEELLADAIIKGFDLSAKEIREFVAQFPDLAAVLIRIYRSYIDANANIEAYVNRLESDPLFSELLHQVLSKITAIHSSAEILQNVSDLSDEEEKKFLRSIGQYSNNLSDVAQNLIGHFDQSTQLRKTVTPVRELDDLIIAEKNYFPVLEDRAQVLHKEIAKNAVMNEAALRYSLKERFDIKVEEAWLPDSSKKNFFRHHYFDEEKKTMFFQGSTRSATRQFQLASLYGRLAENDLLNALANDERLTSYSAKNLALRSFSNYLASAIIFPYDQILEDANKSNYDIDYLVQKYATSFEQVAHRLVTLRKKDNSGIAFGFLRSDPAGRLTKHFPLEGLLLPSSGHACPLWAIYKAFQTGSQTVRQIVRFSDGSRYLFIAKTVTKRLATFKEQRFYSSVMLACEISDARDTIYARGLDLSDEQADILVGAACRLCVLDDCVHRQEEALYPNQMM